MRPGSWVAWTKWAGRPCGAARLELAAFEEGSFASRIRLLLRAWTHAALGGLS
jgi:hypothetical protein